MVWKNNNSWRKGQPFFSNEKSGSVTTTLADVFTFYAPNQKIIKAVIENDGSYDYTDAKILYSFDNVTYYEYTKVIGLDALKVLASGADPTILTIICDGIPYFKLQLKAGTASTFSMFYAQTDKANLQIDIDDDGGIRVQAYDSANDLIKIGEQAPLSSMYDSSAPVTIVDAVTPSATNNYPSDNGVNMGDNNHAWFQGNAGANTTHTVWWSLDGSTQWMDVTASGIDLSTGTVGTASFTNTVWGLKFPNMKGYFRLKNVDTAGEANWCELIRSVL